MAKECPQCKKKNPSAANHCMYCGKELVEAEQLSEEAKLLKKIKEQNEENRLLKAALEAQLKQQKTQENNQEPALVIENVVSPSILTTEEKSQQIPIKKALEQKKEMLKPKRMFAHTFSFKGRIRRLEYGLSCLIYIVWYFIMIAWSESYKTSGGIFVLLTFIPAIWFLWGQGAKRCHDLNSSGLYQIFPFFCF